jgi:hypothetical protein
MLLLMMLAQAVAYVGTYSVLNWPILGVELGAPGGALFKGVLVVTMPNASSTHTAFTGLLTLPNGSSYLVSGVLDNGAITVASMLPLGAQAIPSGGQGVGGGEAIPEAPPRLLPKPTVPPAVPPRAQPQGGGSVDSLSLGYLLAILAAASVISTLAIMALSLIARVPRGGDCVEDEFIGVVRRLGTLGPGTTHRDVGDYLGRLIGYSPELVSFVRLFEEAVYGGRRVDCGEYRRLARWVRGRLHDRGLG